MKFQFNFSIRTKILLMLTMIPLVTLSLFLVLALGIFEKDKIAYVFESTAAVSKTLSAQVGTNLNAALLSAKPMVQELISFKHFGSVSRSIFESEGLIDSVGAYRFENGQAVLIDQIEKKTTDSQSLSTLNNLPQLIQEASSTSNRLIKVPFQDDRVLIVEKVKAPEGEIYFLILALLKDQGISFRSPSNGQNYLIDRQSRVLLGYDGSEGKNLGELIDLNFESRLSDQRFSSGTAEMKTSEGKNWLVSFTKVNFGELYVLSLVPKNEALRAGQVLLKKSILFFLLVLSCITIVSLLASGTITQSLTSLYQATKKIAGGQFDIRVQVKTNDEVGSLATSFNLMAEEVSRLMLETAEKARMEGELKTAQTVQETLFPAPFASMDGFNVAGHYEPASECGGDWWHYSRIGKKIYLWIGDATGHGAPAALITSAAKSAATIIETLDVSPAGALSLLNRAVYDVSKGRIMMTFFLGCFDQETRTFTYANASHEAPFLIKEKEGPLKKKDLISMNEVTSARLGQDRDTDYEEHSMTLEPGDRIFLYTDGLPDIQNPDLKGWGEREFIKGILSANQGFPPIQNSVESMVKMFSEYRQGTALIDDITFFMVQLERDQA